MAAPVSTLDLWSDPSPTMHSRQQNILTLLLSYLLHARLFIGQLRNQNAQNTSRKMSRRVWGGPKNSRMSGGGGYNAWRSKLRLRCSSHPLSHRPEWKGCLRRWARTYGLRHERSEGVAGKVSHWEIIMRSRKSILETCELHQPWTQRSCGGYGPRLRWKIIINSLWWRNFKNTISCRFGQPRFHKWTLFS